MKRRFFKRATALLLALVTAMSLVTVSFAGPPIIHKLIELLFD